MTLLTTRPRTTTPFSLLDLPDPELHLSGESGRQPIDPLSYLGALSNLPPQEQRQAKQVHAFAGELSNQDRRGTPQWDTQPHQRQGHRGAQTNEPCHRSETLERRQGRLQD